MFSFYALLLWVAFIPLAIANGYVRVKISEPKFGVLGAHILHTFAFCAVITLFISLFVVYQQPTRSDVWSMGWGYLALTIVFEFLFGHYVANTPWKVLLADYNIFKGRIWSLVLLTVLLAPAFAHSVLVGQ